MVGRPRFLDRSLRATRFAATRPRDAALFALLGRERFHHLEHSGACLDASPRNELERLATSPTNIHEHVTLLRFLTTEFRLSPVLELGVGPGESTVAHCLAARDIGGRVVSVDLRDAFGVRARIGALGLSDVWTFHEMDDLDLPWDEPIGHLFIDTSHEYEHTRLELEKFEPLVRPGGFITLHDTEMAPVQRAVDEHFAGRDDVRPYRFFHNHGLTVLRRAPLGGA